LLSCFILSVVIFRLLLGVYSYNLFMSTVEPAVIRADIPHGGRTPFKFGRCSVYLSLISAAYLAWSTVVYWAITDGSTTKRPVAAPQRPYNVFQNQLPTTKKKGAFGKKVASFCCARAHPTPLIHICVVYQTSAIAQSRPRGILLRTQCQLVISNEATPLLEVE
jgi:hypothetical protein